MSTVFTPQRTLIDVEQFQRMGEAGIFPPDARIELIDGELLNMAPIGKRHAYAVNILNQLLLKSACAESFYLSVQNPVVLPPRSEPQPDLLLLRPPAERYLRAGPESADVLVLIEVADTTVGFDRSRKLPLYARHGVVEVWIVNVHARQLETYRSPSPDGYRERLSLQADQLASPALLPALRVAWGEALGPAD